MPRKNERHKRLYKGQKRKALFALLVALERELIPDKAGVRLYTGGIIACMDEEFLPINQGALLDVLTEAEVHHDGSNRFIPRELHKCKQRLDALYQEYRGEVKNISAPYIKQKAKDTSSDQTDSTAATDSTA
jgi:hypothetical protein